MLFDMLFGKQKIIDAQVKELEDLKKQLSEATEKNSALEKEVNEMKLREFAVAKAMTDANLAAEGILSQAREESGKVKEEAEKTLNDAAVQSNTITATASEKASQLIAEAEQKASDVVSEAESKGKGILAEAEAKSQKRIQDTEDEVRSYASVLVKLNENMKEQARLAQEASKRYAAFYEEMSKAIPGIMNSITNAQLPEADTSSVTDRIDRSKEEPSVTVSDILTGETDNNTVSTEDILNSIT